ncbi:MAG: hypothetical protein Q8L48_42275 [Archangium sp.]|nr:hypothetical protein [Archangium sp.]
MCTFTRVLVPFVALTAALCLGAPPDKAALVFCAPGYPGTTEEAQSRMDEIAGSLGELSGWPKDRLSATYFPQEKAGLARLAEADAAIALVPLPFFLQHQATLKLTPRLAVVQKGLEATQAWALVAKKGTVKSAADLEGWQLFSTAGYAPDFVTKTALAGYALPASVKVTTGGQVLSALRKAATGTQKLAVLVDSEQAASLASLPFGAELEVVHTGPRLPVAVVATVGAKLSAAEWKVLAAAFSKVSTSALEGVRLTGFVPLDDAALAAATKSFGGAGK